jgi:cytochrome c-type biogenesis protein
MTEVSAWAALVAGLLSFLSPCVLPLVPAYMVYLAGTSLEEHDYQAARFSWRTVAAALLFVCGFSTVFVALGAGASAVGSLLLAYSNWLAIIAGIAVIVMGLHFIGLTRIPLLMREKRFTAPQPAGLWSAYVMGLAFAFGWTPCIGPVLGAILAVAASRQTLGTGVSLLAIYSAGLGIPFLIAAFALEKVMAMLAKMRAHLGTIEKAMGALLVLTGIGFLTGFLGQVSYWLLDAFPALGRLG